ncbi:uncharacterized protein LOC120157365, partial [Hibiscus syriacus]|uniref:uncharacterized protein LOC120157365 n=1 Tax=Hibiscus syriacus TaxID=106335 RepID=UPI001922F3E4
MSGAPRLRSMNVDDSEERRILGLAGNKAGSLSARKPASKPLRKVEKLPVKVNVTEEKKSPSSSYVGTDTGTGTKNVSDMGFFAFMSSMGFIARGLTFGVTVSDSDSDSVPDSSDSSFTATAIAGSSFLGGGLFWINGVDWVWGSSSSSSLSAENPTSSSSEVVSSAKITFGYVPETSRISFDRPPFRSAVPCHRGTSPSSSTVNPLSPKTHPVSVPSVLRLHEQLLHSNLSLNASCSSDASTDSFHSRASTGRLIGSDSVASRWKSYTLKPRTVVSDGGLDFPSDGSHPKKRCAWVTPNTDPSCAAFQDEEWGVPVHNDNKLFELLVLSDALSELTWPAILSKRHIFREIFMDFDPVAVSELNEKKLIAPGSMASSLLSVLKLWAIIENANQ